MDKEYVDLTFFQNFYLSAQNTALPKQLPQ